MTAPECPREQDVINSIVTGRWPDQCDEALHVHAANCKVCRELIEVASALCLERDELHDGMSVPSAGQVWWRAAIRARLEATQQVVRPLSWLLGVAVACVVGLTIAVIELLWSPAHKALGLATSWTTSFGLGEISRWLPTFADLTPLTTTGGFVLLGAAACLVLAPLALYFALSDE